MSSAPYQRLLAELVGLFPRPDGDPASRRQITDAIEHTLAVVDAAGGFSEPWGGFGRALVEPGPSQPESVGIAHPMNDGSARWLASAFANLPDWSSPRCRSGLDPQPTLASIVSAFLPLVYNPNLVSQASAGGCCQIEERAACIVAEWVGYDAQTGSGVFTFGGAGSMLYGLKLGLEKAVPGAAARGLRQDVAVIASDHCHACCQTAASWLGIGADQVVRASSEVDGSVHIPAIEAAAGRALAAGRPLAAIVATIGSTDSFAIDDLGAISALADRLAREFRLPARPHVHADAVIGWPWATFNDYDFATNSLGFSAAALTALATARRRIERLRLADSIGVDFHKTGFTPYTSSLFLARDRTDFERLARPIHESPYLYRSGERHPGLFTLETSRSASGALAALANLSVVGKQGYRVLIGHAVDLTQRLRERLRSEPRGRGAQRAECGFHDARAGLSSRR